VNSVMTAIDSWLRPPALSTNCVLVGVPLSTKVPDRPTPIELHDYICQTLILLSIAIERALPNLRVARYPLRIVGNRRRLKRRQALGNVADQFNSVCM
jgi:hypothetical protein